MKKESEKKTQKMKINFLVFHLILVKNDQKLQICIKSQCFFVFSSLVSLSNITRSDLKVKPTRDIYLSYKNVKTKKVR